MTHQDPWHAGTRDGGRSIIQHDKENTKPKMENEIPVGVQ